PQDESLRRLLKQGGVPPGGSRLGGSAMLPFLRGAGRLVSNFGLISQKISKHLAAVFLCFAVTALAFTDFAFAFSAGDRVQVVNTGGIGLRVRSCASTSCTEITNEPDGSRGTIAGGPASGSGFTWWSVNWDNGFSGWSVQNDSTGTY